MADTIKAEAEPFSMPFADRDYSVDVDPPSAEEEAFYRTVSVLLLDLQSAEPADLLAFSLWNAMDTIRRNANCPHRLFASQRNAIRSALEAAMGRAEDCLPWTFNRQRLFAGMSSAACLLDRWAQPPDERRERMPYDLLGDHYAHVRILLNELDSFVLSADIALWAVKREAAQHEYRAAVIDAMLAIDTAKLPVLLSTRSMTAAGND